MFIVSFLTWCGCFINDFIFSFLVGSHSTLARNRLEFFYSENVTGEDANYYSIQKLFRKCPWKINHVANSSLVIGRRLKIRRRSRMWKLQMDLDIKYVIYLLWEFTVFWYRSNIFDCWECITFCLINVCIQILQYCFQMSK